METSSMQKQEQFNKLKANLDRIKYKVAVLSGKGGVGKTTIAVNIAALLAKKGYKVGLMDADIDCPNVGKMLGIKENFRIEDGRLVPVDKYGMKILSMAFFQSDDAPTIWRGPLIHSAIMQLVEKSDMGDLDYLIIDMAPGTHDSTLTVFQFLDVSAAIVVTTPQPLAIMDAKKSSLAARHFGKPVGIVENMAGDMFGAGKGLELANELKAPFLGSVPMSKEMTSENPIPAVLRSEEIKAMFEEIAENMKEKLLE
ncbi:MAG: P-loop NTPase [Candidatus Aenigmarchaeota archaeon]|nr:P-loop NTPase [Candidatus Aenigmarchaeota archaeon]